MLWACVKCTAMRAAGLLDCPQCGATEYQEAPGGDVESGAPILSAAAPKAVDGAAAKPESAKKAVPGASADTAPTSNVAPPAS